MIPNDDDDDSVCDADGEIDGTSDFANVSKDLVEKDGSTTTWLLVLKWI